MFQLSYKTLEDHEKTNYNVFFSSFFFLKKNTNNIAKINANDEVSPNL